MTPDAWPVIHTTIDVFTPHPAVERVAIIGSWIAHHTGHHPERTPGDLDLVAIGWAGDPVALSGHTAPIADAAGLPVHLLTVTPDAWSMAGGWIEHARTNPHLIVSTRP